MTQWQPFALPTNGMANPDTWREWAQVKVVMMISSMMVVIIIISCTVSIIDIISIMNMHPAAGKGLVADHFGRRETHVCFPLQVFSLRPRCLMTLVHVVLLCTHVLVDLRTLVQTRSPVLVVCGPQYKLSQDPSPNCPKTKVSGYSSLSLFWSA